MHSGATANETKNTQYGRDAVCKRKRGSAFITGLGAFAKRIPAEEMREKRNWIFGENNNDDDSEDEMCKKLKQLEQQEAETGGDKTGGGAGQRIMQDVAGKKQAGSRKKRRQKRRIWALEKKAAYMERRIRELERLLKTSHSVNYVRSNHVTHTHTYR